MNEIWHSYDEAGVLYALIFKQSNGQVFDEDDGGDTFEAYEDANIANYNVPLTALGTAPESDLHAVDFPAAIATAGVYYVQIMLQDSAVADTPHADDDIPVAQGVMHWDGSAEMDTSTLDALIDTVDGKVDIAQVDLDTITGGSGVVIDTDAVDADALADDAVTEIFDAVSGDGVTTIDDISDQMDVLTADQRRVLNVTDERENAEPTDTVF